MTTLIAILVSPLLILTCVCLGALIGRLNTTFFSAFDGIEIFGVGFLSLGILILAGGALGFMGNPFFPLTLGALSVYGFLKTPRRSLPSVPSFRGAPLTAFLLIAWFAARTVIALLPNGHSDPLYYHLLSGRLWLREGRIFMPLWNPWILQGGLAEYVYSFAAMLTSNNLVYLQSMQLFHLIVGTGGSLLVFLKTGRRLTKSSSALILMALVFITFPAEQLQLSRAKNDGFVLFFLLLALDNYFNLQSRGAVAKTLLFAAGAVAIKHSALFFALPLCGLLILDLWRQRRLLAGQSLLRVSLFSFGCLLLATSSMLRNWWWSGNPFFPAFQNFFPTPELMHPYSTDQIARYTYVDGSVGEILWQQTKTFFLKKPLYALFLLLLPFTAWRDALARRCAALLGLSFMLICLATGQGYSLRFGFMMFALLGLLGLLILENLPKRFFKVALAIVLIGGLWNSGVEVPFNIALEKALPLLVGKKTMAEHLQEEMPYLRLHEWANENLPEGAYLLSTFQNEALFLRHKLSVPGNHHAAASVMVAKSYDEALEQFRTAGMTHLEATQEVYPDFAWFLNHEKFQEDFKLIYQDESYELFALDNLP